MFFSSKKSVSTETHPPQVVDSNKAKVSPALKGSPDKATNRSVEMQPSPIAAPAGKEQKNRRIAASLKFSAAFTQTVTLLMRSPLHKHMSIADLEWLLLPPLLAGQFRLAKVGSKKTGVVVPAGIVLWASVSSEVDKKLSENAAAPLRLRPDEWRSGNIVWLIEAAGDPRIVNKLLTELSATVFKGQDVKVRTRKDGKPIFGTLQGLVAPSLNS